MMSRKFLLAASISLTATVGLFAGFLTGGTWVSAQSLVLGLYGAANVANKKVQR